MVPAWRGRLCVRERRGPTARGRLERRRERRPRRAAWQCLLSADDCERRIGQFAFQFGSATDLPLAGDWDGNGTDTVGVWRAGVFYLRNANSAGPAHATIQYGRATDRPIVGDWNGDGIADLGVKRGNVYYLSTLTGAFGFGRASDQPVAGDWDGDGIDTIGVRRGSTYYLSWNNVSSAPAFAYGRSSDQVVAGDMNGNGSTEIVVFRTPAPPMPADRDCIDFTTQAAAQAFLDAYYLYYGDFARLDADNDGVACETLP